MAAETVIGSVGVIPAMAGITITRNIAVSSRQLIIVPVNRECGRFPTRIGGMTILTLIRDSNSNVIRVG